MEVRENGTFVRDGLRFVGFTLNATDYSFSCNGEVLVSDEEYIQALQEKNVNELIEKAIKKQFVSEEVVETKTDDEVAKAVKILLGSDE